MPSPRIPLSSPAAAGWPSPGEDPAARIADDFFLVAHRDRDGKPALPPRVMGLAMVGALLTELALFRRAGIRDGLLVIVSDMALREYVAQSLLAQILAQPQPLPVGDWLAYFAPSATDAVGHRLARAGVVHAHKRRRGWRFVPTDSTGAFFRAGRLAVMLDNEKPLTHAEGALAGLVEAAGLLTNLPCIDPSSARRLVTATVQSLPWPLNGLIAETAAAVDQAIITGRT